MKMRMLDLPPTIDQDMFRYYRKFRRGEFIMFFLDTAGEGSDYNAGQSLSKEELDVPLVLHYQGSITDVTPKLKTALEWIADETGVPPCVSFETNNGGGYELERLNRLNMPDRKYVIYQQYKLDPGGKLVRTDKLGWNTNSATRPAMLKDVEDLVKNRLVRIYDPDTITEMFSFVKHITPSGWRAEAESGTFDDLIMALAGVWQMYQTEQPTAPFNQIMQQLPTNDIPVEMQTFGIGAPTGIMQPDSNNPFGRRMNVNGDDQMFDPRTGRPL